MTLRALFLTQITAGVRHVRAMRLPIVITACAGAAICLMGLAGLSQAQPPKAGAGDAVLLELFTSQGCSSCPPADELLADYSKKPGVITLSFSVDYWNYLGWHDTLSSPESSERQREYAHTRGDGRVYTPQVVVDGISHVNGANAAAIDMAIRKATMRLKNVRVPVTMHAEGNTLVIDIDAAPKASSMRAATVWLAVLGPGTARSTTIRPGCFSRALSLSSPIRISWFW